MSLKLLLYTHDWFPQVGGIQTVTMALAKGLSDLPATERGASVTVTLATATPAGGMDDSALPFRVVRRPSLGELISEIRSADVVHLAGAPLVPLGLSVLFRKPVVIEHDGYQVICPNGLLLFGSEHSLCPGHFMAGNYGKCMSCNTHSMGRWGSLRSLLLTFVRRWLAGRASVHVAPSRHIGKRIALPRTQLIVHGVAPVESRSNPGAGTVNRRSDCFAFVGRLVREKGTEVLIRAAKDLSLDEPDFHIKILGDGPERPVLEKMAQELGVGDRIEFVGSVPSEGIPAALADAATVIMPSVCEDVAPLVAVEQLMQGRLLIGSDIGGLGEITNGFGLKFPPGDASALAACMQRVIHEPRLAEEMGEKARQHALQTFTVERMIEDHLRLYQQLSKTSSATKHD